MLRRIKYMVERILAKAKQSNCTLNQLVGVVIGASPTRQDFQDLNANSKSPKKSWHFQVKEIDLPCDSTPVKPKISVPDTDGTRMAIKLQLTGVKQKHSVKS